MLPFSLSFPSSVDNPQKTPLPPRFHWLPFSCCSILGCISLPLILPSLCGNRNRNSHKNMHRRKELHWMACNHNCVVHNSCSPHPHLKMKIHITPGTNADVSRESLIHLFFRLLHTLLFLSLPQADSQRFPLFLLRSQCIASRDTDTYNYRRRTRNVLLLCSQLWSLSRSHALSVLSSVCLAFSSPFVGENLSLSSSSSFPYHLLHTNNGFPWTVRTFEANVDSSDYFLIYKLKSSHSLSLS